MQVIHQHNNHVFWNLAMERRGNLHNSMEIVKRVGARIRANNWHKALGGNVVH